MLPPRTSTTSTPDTLSQRRPSLRAIKVMIVDDHTVLRDTLRLLLESHTEVEVIGEASDGRQAIDLAEQLKPDVILMDTVMPQRYRGHVRDPEATAAHENPRAQRLRL
jgi:DNA-binding NarL/FixJ family response regulator